MCRLLYRQIGMYIAASTLSLLRYSIFSSLSARTFVSAWYLKWTRCTNVPCYYGCCRPHVERMTAGFFSKALTLGFKTHSPIYLPGAMEGHGGTARSLRVGHYCSLKCLYSWPFQELSSLWVSLLWIFYISSSLRIGCTAIAWSFQEEIWWD